MIEIVLILFFVVVTLVSQLIIAYVNINVILPVLLYLSVKWYNVNEENIKQFYSLTEEELQAFFLLSQDILIRRKHVLGFGQVIFMLFRISVFVFIVIINFTLLIGGIRYLKIDSIFAGASGTLMNTAFLIKILLLTKDLRKKYNITG
jgi:hypothetical protein